MNEDEHKEPVVLSREELYRQVWETPMIRLGEKYGISGNGLKKVCHRLDVPYPPLGYWAKLRAGKAMKVPALPEPTPSTPRDVKISPTPLSLTRPKKSILQSPSSLRSQEQKQQTLSCRAVCADLIQ